MIPQLSVCCMTSGRAPGRVASILSLLVDVADEIVVAVEEARALETYAAVAGVADRVLTFPAAVPSDRPIAWLFESCRGRWIFNIDDDEVPSPRLISLLPRLTRRHDITHAWIARRWLHPTPRTHLGQAPWSNEFQLRLVLADERFLQYSDVFHRPVVAHGPGLFVGAPLWHLDTVINPFEHRRAKAEAYELERPGMRISGVAHNRGLYLPELLPNVALEPVPAADRAQIEAVLVGDVASSKALPAKLVHAARTDIDHAWPGTPLSSRLHRGSISVAATLNAMRAGVQETIDVNVRNDGDRTWRWGKDARPEIRLAYRWLHDGEPVHEPAALRTVLPADLAPGDTQLVPLHVVPPTQAGHYTLELELRHEGVRRFGLSSRLEIDVRERELVAVIGDATSVTMAISQLGPPPYVEPVVVLGNDSDRIHYHDYPIVAGLRTPLLEGLETSGRLARATRLIARSTRIIHAARRYRRVGTAHDPVCAALFEHLRTSRCLLVCGPDWPADAAAGREWWRLTTTLLASRAVGTPVHYTPAALPQANRARDAYFRRLIMSFGTPTNEAGLWPQTTTPDPPHPSTVIETPLETTDDRKQRHQGPIPS